MTIPEIDPEPESLNPSPKPVEMVYAQCGRCGFVSDILAD